MEHLEDTFRPIQVIIADDSVLVRKVVETLLMGQDDIHIAGMATNGQEAIDACKSNPPDVLILDVEMPIKDGIEVLRELRGLGLHTKVILLSNVTQRFAPVTVQGLALGAVGYIPKPSATEKGRSLEEISAKLLDLIQSVAAQTEKKRYTHVVFPAPKPSTTAGKPVQRVALPEHIEIVVIASSTGGPNALSSFFKHLLPPSYPIVLVQHMPKVFLPQLASRLQSECQIPFVVAEDQEILKPGHVYVAPGEIHTKIERNNKGELFSVLFDGPPEVFCKPSANPLFRSAAMSARDKCIALVLTGMGNDGLHGAHLVRHYGGYVMVQDKDSSVVWGMPGAVADADLAHDLGSPEELASRLNAWLQRKNA